jgi:glycosyltransferase involved in cell wall biosynthesis
MYKETTPAPLITIGITAYNAANTVSRAINSALKQDWPNFEIVVVDDASSDQTPEILNKLASSNEKIRVFTQDTNKGVAAARNRIIAEAQGDFIALFDDDDESTPDRIRLQYQRITDYEQAFSQGVPVLCHSARLQKYPNGGETIAPTAGCALSPIAPHGQAMLERLLWGKPCKDCFGATPTCSQMARKRVYESLNGFDNILRRSEDTELTIRHAAAGGHFVGIATPLVTQTMTMSTDKKLGEELACTLYYLKKHRGFFPSPSAYMFQEKWIKAKYAYFSGNKSFLIKTIMRHPFKSLQKILWALPSYATNQRFKSFYKGQSTGK